MPSQDGTRSFSFRIPANGSIVAPNSLLVVAKTLQSKEPGALLSAGGALPYARLRNEPSAGVFDGTVQKGRSPSPPTIFDSLMTRRGLGGCDPQRDRGGGKREGASHLLGRADSCFLLPLPRFPHCLPEGFNLSSRFFQAFANPMSERGERDGRCWGSVSWTSAGPSTRTACRFMRGALRMGA